LYTLMRGRTSGVWVDPVEKKPLFHVEPGSKVYSLGSVGCSFRCPGCQNWQITRGSPDDGMEPMEPETAAEEAVRLGCRGIAWTYNDPVIWIEQTLPGARRARELGLFTVYVTNGYATPEHLELIGPHLSVWRVDLKGFSRATYKRVSGVARFEPVLEATLLAKRRYGMHVECVTNVTPTVNDDEKELRDLARWIRTELGPLTPWHVTRFFPYLELSHLPPTPLRTLERAMEIGREEGLRYVYVGNVAHHPAENTLCHACGALLVARDGYAVRVEALRDGRCSRCGAAIPGLWRRP
jgi:pyruvate formate lyase activating enzyme